MKTDAFRTRNRSRLRGHALALAAWLVLVSGCDALDPVEARYPVVVEAYLVAGERLPEVRLSRTEPFDEPYSAEAAAVRGAAVAVLLLDDRGEVEERFEYVPVEDAPGLYRPQRRARGALVEPQRSYALDVTIPGAETRVTARTTVPGLFDQVGASADTVVYRGAERLSFRLTPSVYPGRDQSFFIFTTASLDARADQLTPFARAIFERGDVTLEELSRGSSPVLNEANYVQNADGTRTVRFPWLAVSFFGPNRVTVSALDDNLYDFIRTATVQQGGSTLAPGEIPNVLDHVEGGTGVFGSMARVAFDVYVARDGE